MSYNYEQSIWGSGTATKKWTDPANLRLRRALNAFAGLKRGAKILDIGCGVGMFIRSLKNERNDLDCFGADISRAAVQQAQKANDGVNYVCYSGRIPYSDNEFDAVMFADVLEHVEDPDSFMKEAVRVLKPGGIFFAFIPCEGDTTSFWNLLDKLHLKNGLTRRFAGHINYFSRDDAARLFIKNHLVIEKRYYSEHILGQLLGIAVFFAMQRRSKKAGHIQLNNAAFFADNTESYKKIKKIVNWLVTAESELLRKVPSPNLFIVAKKV